MRVCRLPPLLKVSVYLEGSSGVIVVSSPPWNFTSCQELPSRLVTLGAGARAVDASLAAGAVAALSDDVGGDDDGGEALVAHPESQNAQLQVSRKRNGLRDMGLSSVRL